MINARELSPTNLVLYNNNIQSVLSVHSHKSKKYPEGFISFIPDGEQYANDADLRNVEPIPLTPKILEQCGFEKSGANSTQSAYSLNYYLYVVKEVDSSYSLVRAEYINNYFVYSEGLISKNIQYLHQLQNLYFSLTGEEIEIKQPIPA
jgi:hypothetical protein